MANTGRLLNTISGRAEKMVAAKATVTDTVKEVGGGTKVAMVNDLWGNAAGLIEGGAKK